MKKINEDVILKIKTIKKIEELLGSNEVEMFQIYCEPEYNDLFEDDEVDLKKEAEKYLSQEISYIIDISSYLEDAINDMKNDLEENGIDYNEINAYSEE